MKTLFKNAYVLTMNDADDVIKNGCVLVEGGKIAYVGAFKDDLDADDIIDAKGNIVMPGLVNTHHHLYQSMTRAVPGGQDALLFGWLKTLYPIWANLTDEAVYVSTQVGLAELALSGCTDNSDKASDAGADQDGGGAEVVQGSEGNRTDRDRSARC